MVKLHKELKLLAFPGIEQTIFLLPQEDGDPFFRSRRGFERTELLLAGDIGNEFDDFLEWLHDVEDSG